MPKALCPLSFRAGFLTPDGWISQCRSFPPHSPLKQMDNFIPRGEPGPRRKASQNKTQQKQQTTGVLMCKSNSFSFLPSQFHFPHNHLPWVDTACAYQVTVFERCVGDCTYEDQLSHILQHFL